MTAILTQNEPRRLPRGLAELVAEQLEALAQAEEGAAREAIARDGWWKWSDDAADHHAAALALHRRARALYATVTATPPAGGVSS